jgi:DNA-binding winged helix-turn-helix (wHTH) protein
MERDMHWVGDSAATSIVFGPFRLFPMQRLLTEAGRPLRLGSRAFDILVALLERPGELVSKEELMARVWPNRFVAPANVAVHISALRCALGERRGKNRYVVNIPGRGYRFVAAVTVEKHTPSGVDIAAPASEHSVPAPLERFVGRTATVHELVEQLSKAAIAIALAEKLIKSHDNGV